jgi:hypothetical protein
MTGAEKVIISSQIKLLSANLSASESAYSAMIPNVTAMTFLPERRKHDRSDV